MDIVALHNDYSTFCNIVLFHTFSTNMTENTTIDNSNRNFKGQLQNEIVICASRKHWIVLLPSLILFAVLVTIIAAHIAFDIPITFKRLMGNDIYSISALVFIGVMTYMMHLVFVRILNYYLHVMILTNFRLIGLKKTLFLHHNLDIVDHFKTQEITMTKDSLIQNILDYGNIHIKLSASNEEKIFHTIPNVEHHFALIQKAKQQQKRDQQNIRNTSNAEAVRNETVHIMA
jgi:hypothetical protein